MTDGAQPSEGLKAERAGSREAHASRDGHGGIPRLETGRHRVRRDLLPPVPAVAHEPTLATRC